MTKEELLILAEQICANRAEEQTIELKVAEGGYPHRLNDTITSLSNQDMRRIIVYAIDQQKRNKQ